MHEAENRNLQKAMTDDRFPRLRSDFEMPILAKDPDAKMVLIGGLGPFGVGRMWFGGVHYDPTSPGFSEAPVVVYNKQGK